MHNNFLNGNSLSFRPINSVSPFTYRDNDTYLTILRKLREYAINNVSVLSDNQNQLSEDFESAIAEFVSQTNESVTNLLSDWYGFFESSSVNTFGRLIDIHHLTGEGDKSAEINSWLSDESWTNTKTLIGDAEILSTINVPNGITLNMSNANLTMGGVKTVAIAVGENSHVFGGTINMPISDYVPAGSVLSIGVDIRGDNSSCVGVKINNAAGAGVRVYDADNATVSDNTIIGPGAPTIAPGDGTCYGVLVDGTSTSVNPFITRNRISKTCQGIGTGSRVTGVIIQSNVIDDIPGQHGMYVHSLKNALINNNRVSDVWLNGIKAQIDHAINEDSTGFTVSDNVVVDTGFGDVDAIVIANTSAVNNYKYKFIGGSVVNNVVHNCKRGLTLGSMNGVVIAGNVVSNVQGNGYNFKGVKNSYIDLGVLINATGQYGAYFAPLENGDVNTNNTVTARRVFNAGTVGSIVLDSHSNTALVDIDVSNDGVAPFVTQNCVFITGGDQSTLRIRNVEANTNGTGYPFRLVAGKTIKEWTNNYGARPSGDVATLNFPTDMPVRIGSRGTSVDYVCNRVPVSGTFNVGDRIHHPSPGAGSSMGWAVTSRGGAATMARANETPYAVGQWVSAAGRVLEATVTGTTGTSEPTIPTTLGAIVNDGTMVWRVAALSIATFKPLPNIGA